MHGAGCRFKIGLRGTRGGKGSKKLNDISAFSIGPNPCRETLHINYSFTGVGQKLVEINLYNLEGRRIKSIVSKKQESGCYSIKLNTETYNDGIYFIRFLLDGKQVKAERFLLLSEKTKTNKTLQESLKGFQR